MSPSRRRRGVSLAEVMVATAFMAVAVTALLQTIWVVHENESVAKNRAVGLATAETMIAEVRTSVLDGTFATGTTSSVLTLPGIKGDVTKTRTVTQVSGFTELYEVVAKVAWSGDSVQLVTYVRYPDG